jgi:small GTP-binding protein
VQTPSRAVSLEVWDTAGQEVYRSLVPIYLRGARLAILVLDLTSPTSLAALPGWVELAQSALPEGTPMFVVANKTDLIDAICVDDQEIRAFAHLHDFPVFHTSAITGDGIEQLFAAAAETVMRPPAADGEREFDQDVPPPVQPARCC